MKINKKGLSGLSMVLGVIILVILVLFSTSLFGHTFGKGNKEISRYLAKGDYDQDGFTNAIDACPCDIKDALSSKAYKLKTNLPKNQGLFTTTEGLPDRINKDDAQEIKYYLEDTAGIYNQLYFTDDTLQKVTNNKPSKSSLCRNPTVKEKNSKDLICSYADFQNDFFVKGTDGGFLELCATKPDVCNSKILKAAKTEQAKS